MESRILSNMKFDPGILIIGVTILTVILLVMVIVMLRRQNSLAKKYRTFMRGRGGKSLEDAIKTRIDEIDTLKQTGDLLNKRMRYVENCVSKGYQKSGIVKYDAFKEMGGKLSFAFALLNDENSGFLINSIHSREGCYTYIKEIIKGESYIPLGEEESEALELAKHSGGYTE